MKPKKPKSLAIQRRMANSMYGHAIPPNRDVHSFGIGRVAAATLARNEDLWCPANCVRIWFSLDPLEGARRFSCVCRVRPSGPGNYFKLSATFIQARATRARRIRTFDPLGAKGERRVGRALTAARDAA